MSFKTVVALTIFGFAVHGSLGCMDARNDAFRWGSGASADKMGKESGADGSVSEISFTSEFLFFCLPFLQIKL